MSFVLAYDVEDWAQSTIDPNLDIFERARRNTLRVLDITRECDVKATWFVLGLFAEKFPEVVRKIHDSGHEVACHGYGHLEVHKQTIAEFRRDVDRAKGLLEDIIGGPVIGYRAPFFSLAAAGVPALEALASLGFKYDSSIFPSAMYRNGIEEAVNGPSILALPQESDIVELPPATVFRFGRHWPVAGGGYHRLLPGRLIRYLVRTSIKQNGTFVSYFHPYEIDPDEFDNIPVKVHWKMRLHQGLGRRGFEDKLRRLVSEYNPILASDLAKKIREKDVRGSHRLSGSGHDGG